MTNKITYPYKTKALLVRQNIGNFFVAVLPAELLLEVGFADITRAEKNQNGFGYTLHGTQREKQKDRLRKIANYLDRNDSTFPNSIIIAANNNYENGLDQEEHEYIDFENNNSFDGSNSKAWFVKEIEKNQYELTIPSSQKLASIIDGQHRLFAIAKASAGVIQNMDLICSIFLNLSKPFQAQIFATINSTQIKVDRSLTFDLFGYNVEEENEKYWSPEKLAVFLTRKIGTENNSPLKGRIMIAPKQDVNLLKLTSAGGWMVSTAVIVDGFLRLITNNPKRDSDSMRTGKNKTRTILSKSSDKSPLREYYCNGNDLLIYQMVFNYFYACNELLWKGSSEDSVITKTIGIQAIFDILRTRIVHKSLSQKDISVKFFSNIIEPASKIDFTSEEFKNFSGTGRKTIRDEIEKRLVRL